MKFFMILILLISCGRKSIYIQGEHTSTNTTVIKTIVEKQKFEGKYAFDNQSFIELIADQDGDITFMIIGQSLNSVNPQNSTIGTHPIINNYNLEIVNDKIILPPCNVRYTSRNDLEEDLSGRDITGKHRTDIIIKKTDSNGIKITINIWQGALNDNINTIVATRTLTSD